MTSAPEGIGNAALVTDIFGCWPSFHDAEILTLTLNRKGPDAPVLNLSVHHWELTPEVDSKGRYVLKNHTLTTFRFSKIDHLKLDGFNHQNVLWELEIVRDPGSGRYSVGLPSSFGCEGSFTCDRVLVISAVPWSAE
jgi:hypothetical protein